MSDLQSVVTSRLLDGSWKALHVPSQRVAHGLTKDEAEDALRDILGILPANKDKPALTSPEFSGLAHDIAIHLEGSVSDMLALHDGYARLTKFEDRIAFVHLGGGCKGCPSSRMTLVNGVKTELIHRFGQEAIDDVLPTDVG